MIRRLLLLVLLGLASTVSAQTTTTRTDRLIASTSVTIGGTTFTTTAATLGGTLAVTGASTLNGAVTLGDAAGDAISFSGRVSTSILWTTDNSVDLGASGANRPRDFFLARNAAIGGTLGVTGASTLAALSATTGSFSSTLGVTGASTLATLSATMGTFSGDVAINGNDLTSTGVLTVRPTGNLTLDPTGDLILSPDGNDILPDTPYSKNLGAYANKLLTIHAAELWIDTLVAQQKIATIGGSIVVSPTTTLTRSVTSGDTVIYVKHNAFLLQVGGVEYGSKLILQSQGKFESMLVENLTVPSAEPTGDYAYTVQRNLDGTGANTWEAGDAVVDTGKTGSGFIDIYSTRGLKAATEVGPTLVGNVRLSGTWNDWAPRWGLGNLDGLCDYSGTAYGAFFGNCATANVTIDATNGLRIRHGTTNKLQADISGNLNLTGDLVMGTAGVIRSGATALDTTTGYWLAHNAGTPQFRIGTMSGSTLTQGIRWDGSALTVKSTYATLDSTGIGTPLAAAGAFATTNGYRFTGSALAGDAAGFYGYETAGGRVIGLKNDTTGTADTGISIHTNRSGGSAYLTLSSTASLGYTAGLVAGTLVEISGGALGGAGSLLELEDNRVRLSRMAGGNYPLWIDTQNKYVGINSSATPSYVVDITGPSTGAKLFRATCSGCGSLFGYADSGGAGITNADPYSGGSMVYMAGTTTTIYASGTNRFQVTTTGVDIVGAITSDGATGLSATINPSGCTSMTFTDGLLTAKVGC